MKKKIISVLLLCSLFMTGCDKFDRIMDILLEKETETSETEAPEQPSAPAETETSAQPDAPAETETSAQPDAPAETETSAQPDAPTETETSAQPDAPAETETSAQPDAPAETETSAQPETPEQTEAPEQPEPSETEESILPETESFAGHWECQYTDAYGDNIKLYLTMTEDGRASYSYGYAYSEIAEVFGGWWGIADAYLALNLTGGVLELELGYVPTPYDFESVYDYEWVKPGSSFKLRLNSGTALLFGSETAELTFECTGTVNSDTFDPFAGVRPNMDPNLVIGDWHSTYWHPDGYELAMQLTVNADGTASYLYRHAGGAGEIYEVFEGTWIADAAGNFILDMHGGWANAEDSEHYDFNGKFRWNLYGNHLGLSHVEGNPLISGCENWFFEFLPFDYVLYDGEWITFDMERHYDLHLLPNGESWFIITEGTVTVCRYEGWWSVSDQAELELSMKLMEGEGSDYLNSIYILDWAEFPYQLNLQLGNGGYALTTKMAVSGSDIFSWIDPNAVG